MISVNSGKTYVLHVKVEIHLGHYIKKITSASIHAVPDGTVMIVSGYPTEAITVMDLMAHHLP